LWVKIWRSKYFAKIIIIIKGFGELAGSLFGKVCLSGRRDPADFRPAVLDLIKLFAIPGPDKWN
jgi:hypothetical protein